MSGYLIDTDWIIDALHGKTDAVRTLVRLAPDGLSVSIISYEELYEGAFYARDAAGAISGLKAFLTGKDILLITTNVAERFAILRGSVPRPVRNQIGDMDFLMAATAITHGLVLLTRNVRDFGLIPGISLYQT